MSLSSGQLRQPKGIPVGGEWSVHERPEAHGVDLSRPGLSAHEAADRHLALVDAGYVPAVATRGLDPATTAGIENWWGDHFVTAEYRASGDGFPQMPDDNTPGMGAGNALSGSRRTHRVKYRGEDMTLRMPSATAIKRFANESDEATFDVPVGGRYPDRAGGPDLQVAGWVRVTRSPNGNWSAVGMGFPGAADEAVAEGVASILEARRPSHALRDAGSIIAKHRARLIGRGSPLQSVSSQWISAVGYDDASGVMATQTATGAVYGHLVTRARFGAVAEAHSPGSTFNQLVRGSERVPVANCDNCGRFFSAAGNHTCPTPTTPVAGTVRNAGPQRYATAVLGATADAARTAALSTATAAVPRGQSDGHRQYYADNDAKHFGTAGAPGSTFTDPDLTRTEDVVALAASQRGSLAGDDREAFIAAGADPDAFADGKRYLQVHTPGTVGVVDSRTLADTDQLEVVRDKEGVPCSLVATVTGQPVTDVGCVIVTTDSRTGADLVLTTFPGPVTRPAYSDQLDRLEGTFITVQQARRILGRDFHANTRVQAPAPGAHTVVPGAQRIDTAAQMAAQLAGRSTRTGYFGKPGWTMDTVAAQIAPFTSSTYAPYSYSEYEYDGVAHAVVNGGNDLYRFGGLGASGSAAILSTLTRKQASATQNDGPALGALLQAAVDHPGKVEVHGYAVGPGRQDERLTAEGIFIYDPTLKTEAEVKRAARATYGLGSATYPPDQITLEENPWRPGEKAWRLWWD